MELVSITVVFLLLLVYIGVRFCLNRTAPPIRAAAHDEHPSAKALMPSAEPLLRTAAQNSEKPKRKRTVPRIVQITVETPLGPVTLKKTSRHATALVIALGQSEDHLRWYFDVYRRAYLKRAVGKLNAFQRGLKDATEWGDSYFAFIQDAPRLLDNLSEERDEALRENRKKIQMREITVLGTYDSLTDAQQAARYLSKKREPTLNAGWLEIHVVAIPHHARE